jgi:hypothetical protein
LWFGPLLLLILAWQIWDRHEEKELKAVIRQLTDGAPRSFRPETPDDAVRYYLAHPEGPDDAVRYYLAAVSLVRVPATVFPLFGLLRDAAAGGAALPPEKQAAIAAVTRLNEPAMRLIGQGATLPFVPVSAVQRYVARYVSLQALDNACALTMLDQVNRGDLDAAAALLVSRIKLVRVFDFERNTFNEYGKVTVLERVVEDGALLVGRRGVSADRLSAIDRALGEALNPGDLEIVIRGETLRMYESGQSLWGDFASFSRLGLRTPMRPATRRSFREVASTTLDAIDVARQPWPARIGGMKSLTARDFRVLGIRVETMVSGRMMAPTFAHLTDDLARTTAKTRALRVVIHAELQRRERGSLPARLEAIAGVAGDESFSDPFSGKALAYLSSPGELLVYSVGENGQDDGGRMTRERASGSGPTTSWPDLGVRVALR